MKNNTKRVTILASKKIIATMLMCICLTSVGSAQNPLSQKVQTELGFGITSPLLHNGNELNRSADIRNNELSYFANEQGDRKNVGSYGNLIGSTIALAYYHPVKKVKGLMLGSTFRINLTGSQPNNGGYSEAYFFNFFSLGLAVKYYPFIENNLFFKADGGIASVMTKNRYLNVQNEQEFFHQFGVGANVSSAIGYSFQPFKNKLKTFDLQMIYQFNSTRVELNGIGDDQWTFSGITLMGAINF